MELHARLVHLEAGLRVVEVRATRGGEHLGSSLAEATTAQEAEDLAAARLLQRLGAGSSAAGTPDPAARSTLRPQRRAQASQPHPPGADRAAAPSLPAEGHRSLAARPGDVPTQSELNLPPAAAEPGGPAISAGDSSPAESSHAVGSPASPGAAAVAPTPTTPLPPPSPLAGPDRPEDSAADLPNDPQEEPPADPEDWSQELTAIDLHLRRLGWSRDQEGLYLQRAFGHPSRSRLTRYSDLRAYLMALEGLERGSDAAVAAVPLRRSELLAQGDALMEQLGWSADQGRAFLERELSRISRQQLSDVQLLQFNMLLEGELLARDSAAPLAAAEGAQR